MGGGGHTNRMKSYGRRRTYQQNEKLWEEEEDIPTEWKKRISNNASKMEDLSNCNYRAVTRLAEPGSLQPCPIRKN
ncbi:hypothetical protein BgiBS90_030184 [Biomphalaria glabrata]|nr:hypothetical protein BgiBS90_030184 [Biomphalaria glabrata]